MENKHPYPDTGARKLAARKWNERLKLGITTLNTAAMAIFGAAFIAPTVAKTGHLTPIWISVATVLHLVSQWLFRFLRSED